MPILVFDVDSTITDARKPINKPMLDLMLGLADTYQVWLVTGSDEPKCRDQIGILFNSVDRVYCCAGAELWMEGALVRSTPWNPPVQLIIDLFSALDDSGYDEKVGNHVEIRTGMVNLSIPGRKASQAQRDRFIAWDDKTGTRKKIVKQLHALHPEVHVTIGGKTGIDITKKGYGKHVIVQDTDEPIWFWGDECGPGGNDESLALALVRPGDKVFKTTGWQDTYSQLMKINKK